MLAAQLLAVLREAPGPGSASPGAPSPASAAPAAPPARAIGCAARPPPLPARLAWPPRPPPTHSPPRRVFPFSRTSRFARSLLSAMAAPGQRRHPGESAIHTSVHPYIHTDITVWAQAQLCPATARLRKPSFRAKAAEGGRVRVGGSKPLNSVLGMWAGGQEGWAVGWGGSAGKGRTAESGQHDTDVANRR